MSNQPLQPTILRSEAAALINTGVAVTLEYVEADRRRGTGGKLVKLVNWAKMNIDTVSSGLPALYVTRDQFRRQVKTLDKEIITMYHPENTMLHPKPVHYWLMCTLNGKRIING